MAKRYSVKGKFQVVMDVLTGEKSLGHASLPTASTGMRLERVSQGLWKPCPCVELVLTARSALDRASIGQVAQLRSECHSHPTQRER